MKEYNLPFRVVHEVYTLYAEKEPYLLGLLNFWRWLGDAYSPCFHYTISPRQPSQLIISMNTFFIEYPPFREKTISLNVSKKTPEYIILQMYNTDLIVVILGFEPRPAANCFIY